MIHCEIISKTILNDRFHTFSEQLQDVNPASVVQRGRRPRSKSAYMLAYYKAFVDPNSDTSDVQALLGLMHFGMLCAGPELDIAEVTGFPHGLRCLSGKPSRRGIVGIIITGDGDQWATAIRNAGTGPASVQEWGVAVYNQFASDGLNELFGTIRPTQGQAKSGYYLE